MALPFGGPRNSDACAGHAHSRPPGPAQSRAWRRGRRPANRYPARLAQLEGCLPEEHRTLKPPSFLRFNPQKAAWQDKLKRLWSEAPKVAAARNLPEARRLVNLRDASTKVYQVRPVSGFSAVIHRQTVCAGWFAFLSQPTLLGAATESGTTLHLPAVLPRFTPTRQYTALCQLRLCG